MCSQVYYPLYGIYYKGFYLIVESPFKKVFKMNIQELINKGVTNLEELLKLTDANYKDLHERLGIKKKRLTMILKNPKECGDLKTAIAFGRVMGVNPSVLVNELGFGKSNITIDEMETLVHAEQTGLVASLA